MKLPILAYHNIDVAPPAALLPSLYVSPARFERQLSALRKLGIRGVTLSEGLARLSEGRGRFVVITLDDGYVDNLRNALPILMRFGFRATCYVTSGALGEYNAWDATRLKVRKPIMSAAQLLEWRRNGMEVGAHTRTHPHLPELDAVALERELVGGKADLEEVIGEEVVHFAYPYGEYDDRSVAAVRAAGFASATTLHRGRASAHDDAFLLPRIQIRENDSLPRLLLRLLTPYEGYHRRSQR